MALDRRALQNEIGTFVRQYGRTSRKRNGSDPNDRGYSRKVEQKVSRLSAEELDALLREDDPID